MKLGYDNFDDAKSKLVSTYALYKGKAFYIQYLHYKEPNNPKEGQYTCEGKYLGGRQGTGPISLDDPDLNVSDYNIGYVNQNSVSAWFYRIPQKQYKQGLTNAQINVKVSNQSYMYNVEFNASKSIGEMLENNYPNFKKASGDLSEGKAHIIAFHRNFAIASDKIHKDFVVEYKGQPIGHTTSDMDFKLLHEYQHLYEALKEAAA